MTLKFYNFFNILLPFLIILSTNIFTQSITWQRLYDHSSWEYGNDICEADNGNFYVVGVSEHLQGTAYILKINPYGDTIWTRILPYGEINAVTPSGDGGCVITGFYGSGYTVKVDKNGSVIWAKLYSGPTLMCSDIIRTSDGCYVVSSNLYYEDACVFKTDSLGNMRWQKFYPSLVIKNFNSIVEAQGGGYVITGIVQGSVNDTIKILLLKIDTSGNVVWDKRYKVNNMAAIGLKIVQTTWGYLVGGQGGSTTNISQICFIKTDLNGNLLYSVSIPSTRNEFFGDIKYLSQNKYVFSLGRDSSTIHIFSAFGMLTDSIGNVLIKKRFNENDFGFMESVLLLNNGDLIFAGNYEYDPNGHQDIYVVRTDSLLNTPPIGIINKNQNIPTHYKLYQAYPNPFNPTTKIRFDIPNNSYVSLNVYDILGRLVNALVNETLAEGSYNVKFNGENLPSGIYFYNLKAGEFSESEKMILIK